MTNWVPNNGVVIDDGNQYQSVLYITSLSSVQDGMYLCNVNVSSDSYYVTEADTTSDAVIFNVSSKIYNECIQYQISHTDPMIENFSAMPTSILGLETSRHCPSSDPYDNFTLTCTASKPTIVLSDLILVWTHNGTIRNGTVSTITTSDTTTVTNTLSYSTTLPNNSGTYSCNASLYLPNKAIYNITEITATIKCKCTIIILFKLIVLLHSSKSP